MCFGYWQNSNVSQSVIGKWCTHHMAKNGAIVHGAMSMILKHTTAIIMLYAEHYK